MLELAFDLIISTIPTETGRAIVYVVTFGRVSCSDNVAAIVGYAFWILVFIAVGVWFAKS